MIAVSHMHACKWAEYIQSNYISVIQSSNSYWWRYVLCNIWSQYAYNKITIPFHPSIHTHTVHLQQKPKLYSHTKHIRRKVHQWYCVYYSQMSNFVSILQIIAVVNVRKSIAWEKMRTSFPVKWARISWHEKDQREQSEGEAKRERVREWFNCI